MVGMPKIAKNRNMRRPSTHRMDKSSCAVRQQCGSTHKTGRDRTAVRKKGRFAHGVM